MHARVVRQPAADLAGCAHSVCVCVLRIAFTQMEGSCFSLSALERRIGAIFFYWDVYNMFLQVCTPGPLARTPPPCDPLHSPGKDCPRCAHWRCMPWKLCMRSLVLMLTCWGFLCFCCCPAGYDWQYVLSAGAQHHPEPREAAHHPGCSPARQQQLLHAVHRHEGAVPHMAAAVRAPRRRVAELAPLLLLPARLLLDLQHR